MDLEETGLIDEDIENHWHYKSKGDAVMHLLRGVSPSVVLDVGAGSGFFSKTLLSNTASEEAWCIDINYIDDEDSTVAGKPIHYRHSIAGTDADLVLMLDVLEHVSDDVGLLREYSNKVSSGTKFLVSVPAFQILWSGHDVFLEHHRRYRLHQIEHVVREAGLNLVSGAYYFGAIFPLALSFRIASKFPRRKRNTAKSDMRPHSAFVNRALTAICRAEIPFFLHNRVAGLTAFVLAEKPAVGK